MLIKALNEYYDILARNDKVCKDGFSRQNITHMIMLRKDGTVSDIINVEQESEPTVRVKPNFSLYRWFCRRERRNPV